MSEEQTYASGLGKGSAVPPEIKGWNWGAFLLNWVWGIGNSTYIALLMFVPFVNIIMLFVLGAKGNQWAWQNRTWRDVEHFKATQKKWAIWGVVLFAVGAIFIYFTTAVMLKGDAYEKSAYVISTNPQVIELVGSPVEPGFFVLGSINFNGPNGSAFLQYSISGPKGEAEAYVTALRRSGQWSLNEVIVFSEEQNTRLEVFKREK